MREKLTDWLAAEGCIEESEKQAYGYAVASLGVVCLPVAAFLVIAAAANRVAESLVMLFVFMVLRRMSGGYHAETPRRCFLVSVTVFCIGLAAANTITERFIWDAVILAASLELFLAGPLISAQRPLEQEEVLINQRKLKRQIVVLFVGYSVLRLAGTPINRYYAAGAVLVGVLHIAGIISAKVREGENTEGARKG